MRRSFPSILVRALLATSAAGAVLAGAPAVARADEPPAIGTKVRTFKQGDEGYFLVVLEAPPDPLAKPVGPVRLEVARGARLVVPPSIASFPPADWLRRVAEGGSYVAAGVAFAGRLDDDGPVEAALVVDGRRQALAIEAPAKDGGDERARTEWRAARVIQAERLRAAAPGDAYLAYYAAYLAGEWRGDAAPDLGRPEPVDLYSLATGSLAIQETLQLDRLLRRAAAPEASTVPLASLAGPTVKSHPFAAMLAGREVATDELSLLCPEDALFVRARSLTALMDALEFALGWGNHLLEMATVRAHDEGVREKLEGALCLRTDPLSRPFYDEVVRDVAVVLGDPFVAEGTDVTLVLRAQRRAVLEGRIDQLRAERRKARPDAVEREWKHLGIGGRSLATDDRAVSCHQAWIGDTYVVSTSEVAARAAVECLAGKRPALGRALDYRYMRTILPAGDAAEDVFVYLSDAFVRKLVGPRAKILEKRRLECMAGLRLAGYAVRAFRVERGRAPRSVEETVEGGFLSPLALGCPDGGAYDLGAGAGPRCSVHNRLRYVTPASELALEKVTEREAADYGAFVEGYERYWSRFFDPIGVRIAVRPDAVALETVVLPLLDNTIYDGLKEAIGGETIAFAGAQPPARDAVLSLRVRASPRLAGEVAREVGRAGEPGAVAVALLNATGSTLALDLHDATPLYDVDVTGLLGLFLQESRGLDEEMLLVAPVITQLFLPTSIGIEVRDEAAFRAALLRLEALVTYELRNEREMGLPLRFAAYALQGTRPGHRVALFEWGPFRLRLHYGLQDGFFTVAGGRKLLEDRLARQVAPAADVPDVRGHLLLALNLDAARALGPEMDLTWEEGARAACLANVGPLEALAEVPGDPDALGLDLEGVRRFCPDGGRYERDPATGALRCPVHGTPDAPRQPAAPVGGSPFGELRRRFRGVAAGLEFTEEGLHTRVVIRRRP